MTFVRDVPIIIGLLQCTGQGCCSAVAGLVMGEVSRFHSRHLRGKSAATPSLGLHQN